MREFDKMCDEMGWLDGRGDGLDGYSVEELYDLMDFSEIKNIDDKVDFIYNKALDWIIDEEDTNMWAEKRLIFMAAADEPKLKDELIKRYRDRTLEGYLKDFQEEVTLYAKNKLKKILDDWDVAIDDNDSPLYEEASRIVIEDVFQNYIEVV